MIFKDRLEAGNKLLLRICSDQEIIKNTDRVVVVSLLRGGVVIGDIIAKGLETKHLPLAVTKIPVPYNPELALGALCFDITYLEKEVVNSLIPDKSDIRKQITIAKEKFNSYLKKFGINKVTYLKSIKNKIVILTDDGIATGSTVKVAILFLKTLNPKSIILAVPVAPFDFSASDIVKEIILHKNHSFGAVSQYYEYFPQIEDDEVRKILKGE